MIKSTVIDLKNFFPEVQEFSHSKTNSAKAFIPTFEDKSWTSILYIERGNFQIRYETGEVLRARGGTFYYHPPLSLKYQTSDKTITPYSMYNLEVDFSLQDSSLFPSQTAGAGRQIVGQFPDKPFVRNAPPLLVSSFKKVFEEYEKRQAGYLLQIENSIRQILISAIRSELEQKQHGFSPEKSIDRADYFLTENKEFMGPIELLFEVMGVSRSRGYELFHRHFGITPKEYILRRKIILAKEMLLEETDITTIAFELGFSSSQSFATTFKRLTCTTPSSYRKKKLLK